MKVYFKIRLNIVFTYKSGKGGFLEAVFWHSTCYMYRKINLGERRERGGGENVALYMNFGIWLRVVDPAIRINNMSTYLTEHLLNFHMWNVTFFPREAQKVFNMEGCFTLLLLIIFPILKTICFRWRKIVFRENAYPMYHLDRKNLPLYFLVCFVLQRFLGLFRAFGLTLAELCLLHILRSETCTDTWLIFSTNPSCFCASPVL